MNFGSIVKISCSEKINNELANRKLKTPHYSSYPKNIRCLMLYYQIWILQVDVQTCRTLQTQVVWANTQQGTCNKVLWSSSIFFYRAALIFLSNNCLSSCCNRSIKSFNLNWKEKLIELVYIYNLKMPIYYKVTNLLI